MDLRDYLRVLRRRWLSVVVVIGACLAIAVAASVIPTAQYRSTVRLFVSTTPADAGEAYQGGLFSAERARSYANLVPSRELAAAVSADLEMDVAPDELADQVEATVVPETVLLQIGVTDPSPRRARRLAQAYAEQLSLLVRDLETPPGKKNAPIKATIVGAASLPDEPVSPQPLRNLALGLSLGLLLGAAAAALREILDSSITATDGLEAISTAPMLGSLVLDNDVGRRLAPLSHALDGPSAEAMRVLRTNLQFVDVDGASKVLVVSSAMPEEGKTTTAIGLALAMAQAGRRTILVDGDLRRPRLAKVLDLDGAVGITTVLLGRIEVSEAVQTLRPGRLDVLASGAVPPNPAELMQSAAMRHLVTELRREYDVVIVDAPPLLPVTDAALLASHADGLLMAVRHGRTTRDQVKHALERLSHVDARLVGFVMTMVPAQRHAVEYGYGYGYGHGTGDGGTGDPDQGPTHLTSWSARANRG